MITASMIADEARAAGAKATERRTLSQAEVRMGAIYEECRVALHRYVRKLLPSWDSRTAEDVVQEAMLRAWRHIDTLPTDLESQRRWLFTVARRITIDEHRRRKGRPAETVLSDAEPVPAVDTMEIVVANLSVRHAMGQLSEIHREALAEYVKGHSIDDTAMRLRIAPGTVKSRTHYAIKSIRDSLSRR